MTPESFKTFIDFEKFIEVYEKECELNEFSVKSVNEAAKKIFERYENKYEIIY